MDKINLSAGQIWKARNDILCYRNSDKKGRRVVVNKGELVEFRYEHNAHFRINENGEDIYLFLPREDFIYNFVLIGEVFGEIRFRNNNSMKEIIEARLYRELE